MKENEISHKWILKGSREEEEKKIERNKFGT